MRPALRHSARVALYLNASEVAAAAGLHRFQPREKVLARTFRKERAPIAARLEAKVPQSSTAASLLKEAVRNLSPDAIAAVRDEERPQLRAEAIRALAERVTTDLEQRVLQATGLPEAASLPAALAAVVAETAALEPREAADAALGQASARVEQLQAAMAATPLLEAALRSEVQTARGVRDEPAAVAALPGFAPGDGVMHYAEFQVGGRRLRFGGKCDGRREDSGDLLEVKSRQSRLLGLPQYEWVQVQVYLLLYDKQQCYFREQLSGHVQEDLVVQRDTSALRELLEPGLEEFLRLWDRMGRDEAYCLGILQAWPR
jgi:hypothetical protein